MMPGLGKRPERPGKAGRRDTRARTHFIISSPRSGSTWMQTMLNHHPSICCTENRLFGRFFEIWPNGDGTSSPRITMDEFSAQLASRLPVLARAGGADAVGEQLLDQLIDSVLGYVGETSGKACLVDKVTPYLGTAKRVLNSIRRHFPGSKIVHLVRDARDVATSGVFHWVGREERGQPRHEFFVARRPGSRLRRFFDDAVLRQWASYWLEAEDCFDDAPAAFTLRYEDLLRDPERELGRLLAYLDVSTDGRQLCDCVARARFEVMSGGRRPGEMLPTAHVRSGVAGDWRKYFTRRDGELLHAIAGDRMRKLDYVRDAGWHLDLPESLDLVN